MLVLNGVASAAARLARGARGLGIAIIGSAALAACNGGSGDDGQPVALNRLHFVTPLADAVRLGKQATFGPDQPFVMKLAQMSISDWIDEQFTETGSTYADLARPVLNNVCSGKTGQDATNCNRDNFTTTPVSMRFYKDAIGQDDQLRQRVAWALSQILVASQVEVTPTAGVASYNQIFLDNAFGNYRDILKAVTLHPFMGNYLDMADSNKSAPSENYARELMQLFSIGTDQLNMDGTPKKDATGATIATYTTDDVKGVAKALTGWTYARINNAAISDYNSLDYTRPMIMVATRYDTTAKTFLGTTVAAGTAQDKSVDAVIDAVFNNASTAPFISKQLIQQLVTSNPSPAYVGRVAAVFANNGSGVRGDMKAIIKAILLDPEARDGTADAIDGKVKEPVLLMTALARIIGMTTDGYAFYARDAALGQSPFRAPSVFNYFSPTFPLPLANGFVSPPTKLLTTSTITARHNFVYDWTINGATARSEFATQAAIGGATGTQPNWTTWEAFGSDVDGMITKINILMLAGGMTDAQRQALKTAMTAITNSDPTVQARTRAQTALYIVATSPQFQVDR